jgi:hypothetical protein
MVYEILRSRTTQPEKVRNPDAGGEIAGFYSTSRKYIHRGPGAEGADGNLWFLTVISVMLKETK